MNQADEPEVINKIWNSFLSVIRYLIPGMIGFLTTYYIRISMNSIFNISSTKTLTFWFIVLFLPVHFLAFRNKVKPLINNALKYFFVQYCILLIFEIVAGSYYGVSTSIRETLFQNSLLANSSPAFALHLVYAIAKRLEDRLVKNYYYKQKKSK